MRVVITLAAVYLSIVSVDCSSTRQCTRETDFTIDIYSGGGFTGVVTGTTVTCNGSVKHWTGSPAAPRVITDSLDLESKDLRLIKSLMQNNDIYAYRKNDISDYTTYLILTGNGKTNSISFVGSDLPAGAPKNLVELIGVLKRISR